MNRTQNKAIEKLIIALGFLVLLSASARAQEHEDGPCSVAFYNFGSLLDTVHDAGKGDYECLPDAAKGWNLEKYHSKLKKSFKVLGELLRDKVPAGPAVIEAAEAENQSALENLICQPEMATGGYRYIHHEGPDRWGVGRALLYDLKQFIPCTTALALSTPLEGDMIYKTHGFPIVGGKLVGDKVCTIISHWLSRRAGESVYIHAAMQVKVLRDSLVRSGKDLKLTIMSDFDDNPMDQGLVVLGTKKYIEDTTEDDLYNSWWVTLEDKGVGILLYRGKWDLFDQIITSPSLLQTAKRLKYDHNRVLLHEYLFQQEGRYKGSPLRTYDSKVRLDGCSDHSPTIIYMRKQ